VLVGTRLDARDQTRALEMFNVPRIDLIMGKLYDKDPEFWKK
jgi:hypothetical protein